MNCLDFQTMPAPFGGVGGGNLFIGQASAPVLSVVPKQTGPPISQVIRELIAAKEAANLGSSYTKNLRIYLRAFARGRESLPISEINLATLEDWFASRAEQPVTRRGNMMRLSAMYSFAKRRGYVSHNPVEQLERVRLDAKPPCILTPAEVETLLRYLQSNAKRRWRLAQVVLSLFAGIRPNETVRLFWRDVDLEKGLVRVDAAASKVRRRRIVPISPNAIAWLKQCVQDNKPIGSKRGKWMRSASRITGIEWHADILRHSCASYMMQKHEDCGKVSRWLGNSPEILLRHYVELTSAEDCAAFWSIVPPPPPDKPKQANPLAPLFCRVEAALAYESEIAARALKRQREALRRGKLDGEKLETNSAISTIAGCSRSAVRFVKTILKQGDADVIEKLRNGSLAVSGVYRRGRAVPIT